jgi:hypothetical protein
MREWMYSLIILDLGTRRTLVVSFTTPLLPPEKKPPVPFGQEADSRVSLDIVKRKIFPLSGFKPWLSGP